MWFNKKAKNVCEECASKLKEEFSFCPYCGANTLNPEEYQKEFGILGKNDQSKEMPNPIMANMGITDKLIGSIMNSLMKNIDQQFHELEKEGPIFPRGIKIKIGVPKRATKQKKAERTITEEQIKKMSDLPRAIAKTTIRRLSDKVIYELAAPGVKSPQDIFISKLESGYEIKAIGEKKIYVNSLAVNLPIRGFAIDNDKVFIEFNTQEDN